MSVCGTICLNCILRTGSKEGHTAYFYRRANKKHPVVAASSTTGTQSAKSAANAATVTAMATTLPAASTKPSQVLMTIPGRRQNLLSPSNTHEPEQEVQVYCDSAFLAAIQLAVGNVDMLSTHAKELMNKHMNAVRGVRETKPPERFLPAQLKSARIRARRRRGVRATA